MIDQPLVNSSSVVTDYTGLNPWGVTDKKDRTQSIGLSLVLPHTSYNIMFTNCGKASIIYDPHCGWHLLFFFAAQDLLPFHTGFDFLLRIYILLVWCRQLLESAACLLEAGMLAMLGQPVKLFLWLQRFHGRITTLNTSRGFPSLMESKSASSTPPNPWEMCGLLHFQAGWPVLVQSACCLPCADEHALAWACRVSSCTLQHALTC